MAVEEIFQDSHANGHNVRNKFAVLQICSCTKLAIPASISRNLQRYIVARYNNYAAVAWALVIADLLSQVNAKFSDASKKNFPTILNFQPFKP